MRAETLSSLFTDEGKMYSLQKNKTRLKGYLNGKLK